MAKHSDSGNPTAALQSKPKPASDTATLDNDDSDATASHPESADAATPQDNDSPDTTTEPADSGVPQRNPIVLLALVTGLIIVVALGGLVGWLGCGHYQSNREHHQHELFVKTARQAAINLTTINFTEAEADMQRVLDSATGTFRDDFQKRSQTFIDVVKQAHAKSEGTVTEAGLESMGADQAQVLVAVTVKTFSAGTAEQTPRFWRMRIAVQKLGDALKVANVEFVP